MLEAGPSQEPYAKGHLLPSLRRRCGLECPMRSFVIVPAVSSTSVLLAGSTLLAFAFAAIATPMVGVVARRLGMVDMPGRRRLLPRALQRYGRLMIAIS